MSHQLSTYRQDIDGMRAVAVLAVILFHLDKGLLAGGFVGVDVFFVISGYLITNNVMEKIQGGRFSIVEFYRARIKRIAPAMLTVVGASLIAAVVLMLPEDAAKMAKSAVWSLASFANVYFWLFQDVSYFAASSEQQPLLHLWSLGVEEQFYLIWPVVLMLVYRTGREKSLFAGAVVVAALSFALGSLYFVRDPSFVYYMLPSRAGELLMGALVAIAMRGGLHRSIPNAAIAPLATVGVILLGSSFGYLSEDGVFPGVRAIPPTLGTALIILTGGSGTTWVARALAWRPLVWLGLLSYSAYLWHWPLLAFYRYGYGEIGMVAGACLFGLTWLLAWATFHFVEQPARNTSSPAIQVFARQLVLPGMALTAIALSTIYADRIWPARLQSPYRQQLAALGDEFKPAYMYDYVCQLQRITTKDTLNPSCVLGGTTKNAPTTLLWGDSNAAHYIGMLGTFAIKEDFRFRNIQVGTCPPLVSDPTPFVDVRRASDCRQSLKEIRPLIDGAEVVVIGAAWTFYQAKSERFLDAFFATARELSKQGKLVILIGNLPIVENFDRLCPQKSLTFPLLTCQDKGNVLSDEVAKVNAKLRQFAHTNANIRYFDATTYLCPQGHCSAYGKEGKQLYYDQTHLAMAGSWVLGKNIVSADGVPEVFQSIAGWTVSQSKDRARGEDFQATASN